MNFLKLSTRRRKLYIYCFGDCVVSKTLSLPLENRLNLTDSKKIGIVKRIALYWQNKPIQSIMKKLLSEKADALVQMHIEKYKNRHSEHFTETIQYTNTEHLINISSYAKSGITSIPLSPNQEALIVAYYSLKNDNVFDALVCDFVLSLGEEASNNYSKTDQKNILRNGLIPIIHKIAHDSFIKKGVEAFLSKQEFKYI